MYFTVGPSQLYPTVPAHLARAMELQIPSRAHREQGFFELFDEVRERLRMLLAIPQDYQIFFVGSANEAMERIVQGLVEQTSVHLVHGAFSNRFAEIATQLKKQAYRVERAFGEPFGEEPIALPEDAELLCVTHNETSAGVQTPMEWVYRVAAQKPEMLVALDVVSSAPTVELDVARLDAVFFSVQKGFGLPAGLCVFVMSPRAMEKARALAAKGQNIGSYHSLVSLESYAEKRQTPATPNTLLIYLLSCVTQDLLTEGLATVRARLAEQARQLYAYLDTSSVLRPFVEDPRYRSVTTPVVATTRPSGELVAALKGQGLFVTPGYGPYRDEHVRIGNFPAHRPEDVASLIRVLEAYEAQVTSSV